jgi:hypothetical protein
VADLNELLNQLDPEATARDRAFASVVRCLQAFKVRRFSGTVELEFKAGRVAALRKTEAPRPDCADVSGKCDDDPR